MSNEPLRCIGALIIDDEGRVFIQRRSASRALFPNTWDVVGGHVEGDETLMETLHREVREETGWSVSTVLAEIGEHAYTGDDGVGRVETDYLMRVDGDLSRPRLEVGKHTEFRWISRDEIAVLDENRSVDGGLMRRIVEDGFDLLTRLGSVLPPCSSKATVVTGELPSFEGAIDAFLNSESAGPVVHACALRPRRRR